MLGRLQRLENGGRRVHLPQESQATEGSKARLAVEGGRNRGETKFDIVKACAIQSIFIFYSRKQCICVCSPDARGSIKV